MGRVQLCGQGYRLDHSPLLFKQVQGSEGFSLHGGPLTEEGEWNPLLSYQYNHGRMYNTLLACSVQLTSTRAGDGGFCIVKGSHKSNFVCPPEMVVRAIFASMPLVTPARPSQGGVSLTHQSRRNTVWAALLKEGSTTQPAAVSRSNQGERVAWFRHLP